MFYDSYFLIGLTPVFITTIFFICVCLYLIAYKCYDFVNDNNDRKYIDIVPSWIKKMFKLEDSRYVIDVLGFSSVSVLLSCVNIMIWPITSFVLSIYISLLLIRNFVRFKKKINEALDQKADKNHTH